MPPNTRSYEGRTVSTNPWGELVIITRRTDAPSTIYNLGDKCISGQVNLVEDGSSTATFTIANPEGKYTKSFTPMDRVLVFGGRTHRERMQMFTGFISHVPFATFRRDDALTIQCADNLFPLHRIFVDPFVQQRIEMFALDLTPDLILQRMLTDTGGPNQSFQGAAMDPKDICIMPMDDALKKHWKNAQSLHDQFRATMGAEDICRYPRGPGGGS